MSKIPDVKWAENNHHLTWALITEMEKEPYRSTFFGKSSKAENTKGVSKVKVCQQIAQAVIPHVHTINAKTAGNRVSTKIDCTRIKHSASAKPVGGLRLEKGQLGEAAGGNDALDFYIGADGPNSDTPAHAQNLWQEINSAFPFFGRLHRQTATRPNVVPIVVTTGVGPHGSQSLWLQPRNQGAVNNLSSQAAPALDDNLSSQALDNFLGINTTKTLGQGAPLSRSSLFSSVHSESQAPPPPLSQLPPSAQSSKRPPKLSTQARAAADKIASVKLVPQKRSLQETLSDITERNFTLLTARADRDSQTQTRQVLLAEFNAGLWTREEYRAEVNALLNRPLASSSSSSLSTSSSSPAIPEAQRLPRAHSPDWPENLFQDQD
ncbi:hypothetical protein DFP72DRAFT_1076477 [Ephemerocybe angulata]|uniref:Uncharacterized protein n=1 Tax=Ephemerocybe angulata TaxID=980116 RepID=A0A8H6LZ04_9AGAR|nr:hypothetical protein DFP72DRAFT_1076477 [Tulosesus angulatus]